MAAEATEKPAALSAILKIFIDDPVFKEEYKKHVAGHNKKIQTDFPDAGFDLLLPKSAEVYNKTSIFINFGVKCSMEHMGNPCSYSLHARSSTFDKYVIFLCNSVGIIDSGYRGYICGEFYRPPGFDGESYLEQNSRIVQLCSPTLAPILVEIVDKESDLGMSTRGTGGFGSTGK
jgi:dUTP pyrophosphatase